MPKPLKPLIQKSERPPVANQPPVRIIENKPAGPRPSRTASRR
jgi:hypothetical protein